MLILALLTTASAHAAIDPAEARRAFDELRAVCARDHGATWGMTLCGPTLFVEPATRAYAADGGDGKGMTSGTLQAEIGIANTAVTWNGAQWTMVMWPLPSDDYSRRRLLAHESFHRLQDRLGFPSTGPANAHLDTVEGRTLLQLEWRALAAALAAEDGASRGRALADALAFRAARRAKFGAAAAEERALEMHEGLAEYTGTALAEPSFAKRRQRLVDALHEAESKPTFVRSFAYASGPAYGALLQLRDPRWTRHLHATDDLGELARAAYRVTPSAAADEARYDGVALRASEGKREETRQAQLRAYRARFVDGAVLTLPLAHMNMQFDPNAAQPFPGHGTVYATITVTDDWGSITVKRGGALMAEDFMKLTVPAANDDYTLSLKPGWKVEGGVVRKE
jgi:hypothetical protein